MVAPLARMSVGPSARLWNAARRGRCAVAAALIVAHGAWSQAACGGDEAEPASERAVGRVELPAGVPLQPSDLQILGAQAQVEVAGDGAFAIPQTGGGPALVCALDADERVILLGSVDADDPSAGEVSPLRTATMLLFHAVGAFQLPRSTWARALELIEASPEASDLARLIGTRMEVIGPGALQGGDELVRQAIRSAAASLVPPLASGALPRRHVIAPQAVAGHITVTGEEQSGVWVGVLADGSAIQVRNDWRRHLFIYVYRTGYDTTDPVSGAVTSHPDEPWVKVVDRSYLQAVNGLDGVLGSLTGLAIGSGAYAPVYSDPFQLQSYAPTDATTTRFTIVVVGPTSTHYEVEVPGAPPSEIALWGDAERNLELANWLLEIYLPVVTTWLPAGHIASFARSPDAIELAIQVIKDGMDLGYDMQSELNMGRYWQAALMGFKAVADSQAFRTKLIERLVAASIVKGEVATLANKVAQKALSFLAALQVADAILQTADLGMVLSAMQDGAAIATWTAEVRAAAVRLSPDRVDVAAGHSQRFIVLGVESVAGTKEYEWSTLGVAGHLVDDRGHSGLGFTSSSGQVEYIADADAVAATDDFVRVKVNQVVGVKRTAIGEASAHVKIIEAPNSCDVTLVPSATFDAWWNGAPACELGPGRWMIDPDTIAGCITTYRCGGTEHGLAWLPYENTVTIYWRLYDAAGEQVAASNCGGWGGTPTEEDPHASCDYALERTHTVYANTDTWCPGQGIIQAPDGRGSVAFSAMKLAGACDIPEFLVPPPYDGEIDFRFVNCDDPRWRTSVSVCAVLPAR